MKATLEFDLPKEQEEHQTAVDASKWRSVVYELDQQLRAQIKHSTGTLNAEALRKMLHDELTAWSLTLY